MKNLFCFVVIGCAFIWNANCSSDREFCSGPGDCRRWCPTRTSCEYCGKGCAWCHAKIASTSTGLDLGWCQLDDGRKNCGTGREYGTLSEILGGDLTSVEVLASSGMCPDTSTGRSPFVKEHKTCGDCTWAGFQWTQVEKGGKLGGVCLNPEGRNSLGLFNRLLQYDLGASKFTVIDRRDTCPATTTTTVPPGSHMHCWSRTKCDGPGGCLESPDCHWCHAHIVSSSTDLNLGVCIPNNSGYGCGWLSYGALSEVFSRDLISEAVLPNGTCPAGAAHDTPFLSYYKSCTSCVKDGFQWCSIEKGGKVGGLCLDTRKTSPALQCDNKFQTVLGASKFTVVNRGGTCHHKRCLGKTSCRECEKAKCAWCYGHLRSKGSDINLGFCQDNTDGPADCGFYNFGTLMEAVGTDLQTKKLENWREERCFSNYETPYIKAYTSCGPCVGDGHTWCGIEIQGRRGGVCLDSSKVGPDMSCDSQFWNMFGYSPFWQKVNFYQGYC